MLCSRTLLAAAGAAAGLLLVGCAAPQHSNTLIFGTSTRLAIDVSQEPTGTLGATIGYKRHEAVFMPLLANTSAAGQPAQCGTDGCRKFVGETGAQGGAAGAGSKDTYSVLATFSGDMSGSAQGAQAKAGVAQYFATGIAARLLAQYGGAAAVSGAGTAPTATAISAAAGALVDEQLEHVAHVTDKLSKPDGSVDQPALAALLAKPPANQINAEEVAELKSFNRASDLAGYLRFAGKKTVDRLYDTLESP